MNQNSQASHTTAIPFKPAQPHPWVRRLYAGLLYLLLPLVPIYLLLRSRKQPEYRQHWGERFTFYQHRFLKNINQTRRIWLHAVSLGETRAIKPIVDELLAAHSDVHIILTGHTPTGRAEGQNLFASYLADGRMTQVYVPYDLNPLLHRFFKAFTPTDVWVVDTEVWPNMVAQCVRRQVPISLINARLSEKTLRQSQKWAKLMRNAYAGFSHICAQTQVDAQRFEQMGAHAPQLMVTGSLKFDMQIPENQVAQGRAIKMLLGQKKVVLLASSREGEEALWLDAIEQYQNTHGSRAENIQWWVVPRHPQRFDEVAQLLTQKSQSFLRKSEWMQLLGLEQVSALASAQIVLGDTMGEMFSYYALADVVLMGGTWLPFGGQNFLEPMALGIPTIIGPSVFNFEAIAQQAIDADALIYAENLSQALNDVLEIVLDAQIETKALEPQKARAFVAQACGAAARTLEIVC